MAPDACALDLHSEAVEGLEAQGQGLCGCVERVRHGQPQGIFWSRHLSFISLLLRACGHVKDLHIQAQRSGSTVGFRMVLAMLCDCLRGELKTYVYRECAVLP